jgi:glycosyltransferase involved in cell wall biosynthesis
MNREIPFLSIITVVFNNLKGIQHTFQSIKNQSSNDFEWIVIDGGSTDGTKEWVENMSFSPLTYISEKDQGLYDAMNKGIQKSRGKYIWFMNSGDSIYSSDAILNLLSIKNDPDIFYGETMLVNELCEPIGIRSEQTTRVLPEKLTKYSMIKGMVVCHQSFIVKREMAPFYNLKYRFSADIDWVINCLEKAKIVFNCKKILSNYLVGGFSAQNQKRGWKERWHIYVNHFGIIKTILAHIFIVFRYFYKSKLQNRNY